MTDISAGNMPSAKREHPLEQQSKIGAWAPLVFFGLIAAGAAYTYFSITGDLESAKAVPWVLLILALLAALGFEFVNGFHDTANAVATVIYTHSLPAEVAVIWSGFFNFLGVISASGAVAFGIISLLPVELIMQVGSGAGLAMVFALLIAAIVWNLGTWYLGLPSSSSHTLIGSIIGVGLANQLMAPGGSATSGVDWTKATEIGMSLLISPVFGFCMAALLLLAMKALVKNEELYTAPKGNQPPPLWIRALLIFTCTGVSFAHGSNDGQKGMGLIMLILIGLVPTAYALNRVPQPARMQEFKDATLQVSLTLGKYVKPGIVTPNAREVVEDAVKGKAWKDETTVGLQRFISELNSGISPYATLGNLPQDRVSNVRNDLYLIGEALKLIDKKKLLPMDAADLKVVKRYHDMVDETTRFIPFWVKVAVALALGLGTMVGWKRIVVTVGEKIGKDHLTYGQGASAELVAMGTIGAADYFGLPVSTTHVLSSGVAGTMAANKSGLQFETVRNMLMAWVLTLPVSILLAGGLFILFRQIF
jgi:inorganic phosphate transporter, PiT family